jgi:hypothetical protein
MTPWPLPGGQVKEAPDQQNFDSLASKGEALEERVGAIEKEVTSSPAVFHPAFLGDLGVLKPVLNTVYFAQVAVPFKFTLTGVAYRLANTAAGNIRSALYNAAGTRVANKTSNVVVSGGSNVTQGVAFDATYVAEPGIYFVALVFSTASPEVYNGTYLCPSSSVAGPGSGATATSITPPAITGAGNFVKMVAY